MFCLFILSPSRGLCHIWSGWDSTPTDPTQIKMEDILKALNQAIAEQQEANYKHRELGLPTLEPELPVSELELLLPDFFCVSIM